MNIVKWFLYRVVPRDDVKEVSGHTFQGFGSHSNNYPTTYLTAAAAIGMTKHDVDAFIKRLDKVLAKFKGTTAKKSVCHESEDHGKESGKKDTDTIATGLQDLKVSLPSWNMFQYLKPNHSTVVIAMNKEIRRVKILPHRENVLLMVLYKII